jgi:hypothetical protein
VVATAEIRVVDSSDSADVPSSFAVVGDAIVVVASVGMASSAGPMANGSCRFPAGDFNSVPLYFKYEGFGISFVSNFMFYSLE